MVKSKVVATKKVRRRSRAYISPIKKKKAITMKINLSKPEPEKIKPPNLAIEIIANTKKKLENAKKQKDIEEKIEEEKQEESKSETKSTTSNMSNMSEILRRPRFYNYSIPKRSFQELCKDSAHKFFKGCRFTREALEALQTAVEDFMVGFFEDAGICMRHTKRKTLLLKDIELVTKLRKFQYEPI